MKTASRTLAALGVCAASVLAVAGPLGAATDTFPGSGVGAIADGSTPIPTYGAPLDVTFPVAGLDGPVGDIEVSITMDHTWVGDLDVVLIAPDNTEFPLFSRVGAAVPTAIGDSSNLGGTYVFSDSAAGDLWTAAASVGSADVVPGGSYRSSAAGTGAPTSLASAFAGVANANGTWTLRLRDAASGDTGAVTAASLTVTTTTPPMRPRPQVDFDGDFVTDLAVVRDVGGPVEWWSLDSSDDSLRLATLGTAATDFFTPADFDGDFITDRAVWRLDASPAFYIEESSTSNVRVVPFGISGDVPTVVGDWDGDGLADPAVFRADDGIFYYLGSDNNPGDNITFVRWGTSGDVPIPADYDGDGRLDAAIARDVAGQFQIWILRSSDGAAQIFNFGLSTDRIVPGDYDGDGVDDLMMVRDAGGQLQWWLRTGSGATSVTNFGLATDSVLSGDFDGTGLSDRAVWRPTTGQFWVLRSLDFGVEIATFGTTGDFPLGNAYVM